MSSWSPARGRQRPGIGRPRGGAEEAAGAAPHAAGQRRRGTRRDVRRATLRLANIWQTSSWGLLGGRAGGRLHGGQILALLAAHQADAHQVERADEAVAEAEPAGAGDRVAQRDGPVVLEQDQRRRRVVRDVFEDVPRVLVAEDVHAVAVRNGLGARFGAGFHARFTLDPEPDQRADLAAELDRLVFGEVA